MCHKISIQIGQSLLINFFSNLATPECSNRNSASGASIIKFQLSACGGSG
ncbi:hypothetical protein D1AOALGA4SA_5221 [Olavius algarvensis Delta 1 endosymbiont]|nr:hypothetical protein D1AOALGA4SA_5221 [Olavius algarvensis Delta 1 endosymbiont]